MKRDEILPAALALTREERSELAHQLLRSLGGPADAHADKAWLKEIERCVNELADGTVEVVDWDDVRERVMRRLEQWRESPSPS